MRLFVAIKISEKLQEEILGWSRFFSRQMSGLKNRGSSMARPSGEKIIRWVKPENLHITLIPPWEEENVEGVKAVLKTLESRVGPAHPKLRQWRGEGGSFEMVFEKVEFGPHSQEPRLIWAEGSAPKEIQNLKIKVESALGKEPENRPFKLHLTLARFHPKDFVRFPVNPVRNPPCQRGTAAAAQRRLTSNGIKKLDEKVFWRQEVKSFVLMESRFLPDGADYEVLEEFQL